MRVLLVEDEPNAARVLAKGLREQAYAVDMAADGETALFQIGTTDYDAVIVDLHMPGLSGLDLLRQLRVMESGGGTRTPVLVRLTNSRTSSPSKRIALPHLVASSTSSPASSSATPIRR